MKHLLYFLSKTDTSIIEHCPRSARNIQASLGFFVLMTGLFAFMSGTYAISNMFVYEHPSTGRPHLSVFGRISSGIIGCIYAMFIMAIDREIVSTTTKWAALFRIPLAIMISLVISVPAELQIFESKITKKLSEDHSQENEKLRADLETRNRVPKLEEEISKAETQRQQDVDKRNYWSEIELKEIVGISDQITTGQAGAGPAYEEAKRNRVLFDGLIVIHDSTIKAKKAELLLANQNKDANYKNERLPQSYDLLSRYIGLQQVIKDESTGAAWRMSWGITLLFLVFELVPAIMKIFQANTEYDALLDKRTKLNIYATRAIYEQTYTEYDSLSVEEIQESNQVIVQKMYETQAY